MSDSREGTYLGSVRNLVTLRERCVIGPGPDGCWHLRSARGRNLATRNARQPLKVFVHGRGQVSARRFALEYAEGPLPADAFVAALCGSADCVRPGHLKAMTRTEHGAWLREQGRTVSPKKLQAVARTARNRSNLVLTEELAQWARESTQRSVDAAHGLGCRQQAVSDIRRGLRWNPMLTPAASVFSFGAAVNAPRLRRSA